jgi:hypothetical protein
MDGSSGAYYFMPGTDPTLWVIYMEARAARTRASRRC